MTAQSAANTQSATMPAPAEVAAVNGVDPEKAKQLTQAVAEQVRSHAVGNVLSIHRLETLLLLTTHFGIS